MATRVGRRALGAGAHATCSAPHAGAAPQRRTKSPTTTRRGDKTATGIRIPDEVVEVLGSGKRPPVKVTINGFTYRSSIATVSGASMVGVSAENRAGAGVAGGDEVDVEIELDTEPREVTV